ncbi:uncharacterized protein DNG_02087 [Cephalotrichum gorgonifer]|uniref:LCCL domain-containing protein n=1 Tax=Cephalotrichum gorgonifer TaxID=2041049 RepID=A0AAE8MRS3_9PEZI|nr:uncharacterized protein DNG_02087 [Cephalotrichum gorgonifer]
MTRSNGSAPRWGRVASDEEGAGFLRTEGPSYYGRDPEKSFRPIPRRRSRLVQFLAGPAEPQPHVVRPILPYLQRWPITLCDRFASRPIWKGFLTGAFFILWLTAFLFILIGTHRPFRDPDGEYVKNLNCDDTLWTPERCGLDGEQCRPFTESHFSFRCPAGCAGTTPPTPRPVGALDVVDRPLVIGSSPFRADSYLCSAAIMASVVSDAKGGCGRITRVGKHNTFVGRETNGVESVDFDSYFPYSFTVSPDPDMPCEEYADPRGKLLGASLFFSAVASLFVTSSALQASIALVAAFVHVALVSDPPPVSSFTASVLPDLVSTLAWRFFPAAFLAVVLYKTCVRRTLDGLTAQVEKVVLWLGGLWLGALANYTFTWIPGPNWSGYEVRAVTQTTLLLAGVVATAGTTAAWQMYCLWAEGRLGRHLIFYIASVASILGLLCIPEGMINVQIHPYIIALLLLPATSMQTRASLLAQGLLLGIVIHSLAHSGFSPPFIPRDPSLTPIPYPTIRDPAVSFAPDGANITLTFDPPPTGFSADGVSVTVNDVERFRFVYAEVGRTGESFTWGWPDDMKYDEYIRCSFIKDGIILGYGGASAWLGDGSFKGSEVPYE